MNMVLRAALDYRSRGWSVTPCQPLGKAPAVAWKRYQGRQATEAQLRAWWSAWPAANVAVLMGYANLTGVDLDGDAAGELLDLITLGNIPVTMSFRTPRGLRYLFAAPEGVTVSNGVLASRPGAEVRLLSAGSYTLAPPSRTPRGAYSWLPGRGPDEVALASAPPWVVTSGTTSLRFPSPTTAEGGAIAEGRRNETLFRLAACCRRHGCTPHEILTLLRTVNARCEPPLTEDELRTIELSVARYRPLP
jgi:hypothetical protein